MTRTARKPVVKKTAVRKTTAKRTTARKTTSRRRRRPTRARRRTSALATTLGTAIGTLAVSLLLGAGWPVQIALVALVLTLGVAFMVLRNRSRLSPSPPGTPPAPSADASPDPTQEASA